MEFPIISASLAAFLIVLQQVLMMTVGMHRAQTKIGVGVGEDLHLERKMRRHGNLAENAAIFLLVLAFVEGITGSDTVVACIAVAFAVARISHALGFIHLDGSHNTDGSKVYLALRAVGAMTTGLGGIALGGYLAYLIAFGSA